MRRERVDAWLQCPECGAGDVKAYNPSMYESLFQCQECGEEFVTNW